MQKKRPESTSALPKTNSIKIRKAQVWIAHRPEKGRPKILLFLVKEERGGGWHPVTGGVDQNETFLAGAKRELLEETGFHPKKGKWIDLRYGFSFEGRWGLAQEQAFGFILTKDRPDPELDTKEHLDFEWVSVAEAKRRIEFEAQHSALMEFLCYLRNN